MVTERDLVQREIDLARDFANKGGPAAAFCHVVTRGEGAFSFARRVDFGLTFIEEPFMAFGSKVDPDDLAEAGVPEQTEGGTPDAGVRNIAALPHCSGFVTEWDLDEQGNYAGAWVAVQVTFPVVDPPITDPVPIRHYFTFQAVAIKDLADTYDAPPPDLGGGG